jgi:large repetitive protein
MTLANTLNGTAAPASNSGFLTVADGSRIALAGTIDNAGTIAVDASATVTGIEILGNATLQSGGRIDLSENNQNYIFGDGSLTNVDNTISGGGDIGNGTLGFVNQGVVEAHGSYALILDTGASPLVNSGTLQTSDGTMIVNSDVVGSGNAVVAGGTLEFEGASDSNVTFAGADPSLLALDRSLDFKGSIAEFGGLDSIDLGDIAFGAGSTLGYAADGTGAGGTLSVGDGTHTAGIALLGQYIAASFVAASDGHGGTMITEALRDQMPPLAQSHA